MNTIPLVGRLSVVTAALIALFFSSSLFAHYGGAMIEQVPVDRVIGNLERLAKNEPGNAAVRLNLARSHAMAYVLGTDTLPMSSESAGPWVEPPAPWVPFSTANPKRASSPTPAARAHLQAAIEAYEAALRLNPRDTVTRLGYGWCLEQSGNRMAAIEAYRAVIPDARELDRARRINFVATITEEAVGYLIPLLDPQKDKEEIERLRGYAVEGSRQPRAITPIIIPLGEKHGVGGLVDHHARIRFDADGSALDRDWTWISQDAGWLVYDHKGTGQITSALQLFGNVTFWMFWSNGYEAMRALDDNQDGTLTGDELKGLAIWRDANSNGVSEQGEVKPVADWGIVALSTRYRSEDESDVYVAESAAGVTFSDGTTRPTYDVLLFQRTEDRRQKVGGDRWSQRRSM